MKIDIRNPLSRLIILISLLGMGAAATIITIYNRENEDVYKSGSLVYGVDPQLIPNVDTWAKHDVSQVDPFIPFGDSYAPTNEGGLFEIRKQNPDHLLIVYHEYIHVGEWQKNGYDSGFTPGDFNDELWKCVAVDRECLARTNELDPATALPDTFANWKRNFTWNATDSMCVNAVVAHFKNQVEKSEYATTPGIGIMFDFVQDRLVDLKRVGSRYDFEEYGEPDLDRDGKSHYDDENEQWAFVDGQIDLIRKTRASMKPGFIMIANGTAAITNPRFTRELDGVYLENFPYWYYGYPFNSPNYYGALSKHSPYSIVNILNMQWIRDNGGPYVFLENAGSANNKNGHAAVCLIYDIYNIWVDPNWATPNEKVYFPDIDFNAIGKPKSEIMYTFYPQYDIISREFQNGIARVAIMQSQPGFFAYELRCGDFYFMSSNFPRP